MKKGVLYFVSGFLAAGILMQLTPGVAEDLKKVVEANLNTANIVVNGQKVDGDNLEYNDSLYIPLRKVSEALGKDVSWNAETKTAEINDKVTKTAETNDKTPKTEEVQKYDSFIFSSDSLTIIDSKTGEISFKVMDENNKEYEAKDIESKFVCSTSYGSATIDAVNHKVIIKDQTGQFKNQTTIVIAFVDKTNGRFYQYNIKIPKDGK
jgi:Copper amine oxidase N-terminal domain.